MSVSQHAPQGCDVQFEVPVIHDHAWPHTGNQFAFGDELARAVGECDQYIERTAADMECLLALEEKPFFGEQTKSTKGKRKPDPVLPRSTRIRQLRCTKMVLQMSECHSPFCFVDAVGKG